MKGVRWGVAVYEGGPVRVGVYYGTSRKFIEGAAGIARNHRIQETLYRRNAQEIRAEVKRSERFVKDEFAKDSSTARTIGALVCDAENSGLAYALMAERWGENGLFAQLVGACVIPDAKNHGLSFVAVKAALGVYGLNTRMEDPVNAVRVLLEQGYEVDQPSVSVGRKYRDRGNPIIQPDGPVAPLPANPTVAILQSAIDDMYRDIKLPDFEITNHTRYKIS